MKSLGFLMLVVVLLAACSQEPIEVVETVEVTREVTRLVEITKEVLVTRIVEATKELEVTRLVEATRLVQVTPTPTRVPAAGARFARNYLGKVSTGGVTMELIRVLFAHKDATTGTDFWTRDEYLGQEYAGEIAVRITNESDVAVKWNFQDWFVRVNERQFALYDYFFVSRFGEDVSEPIFPGSTIIAGVWFPTSGTSPDEVTSLALIVEPAFDSDTYRHITGRFEFLVDLSGEHTWEPKPDELNR